MTAFKPEFIAGLRVFMAHHLHPVWDFMSLINFLQHHASPARWPWAALPRQRKE